MVMVIYVEGHEVLRNKIEEIQDQKELSQKNAFSLSEEISTINGEIRSREKGVNEIENCNRRIIMRGILKNKQRTRTVLCLELKELNEAIKKYCIEIFAFTLAQQQLEWDGPEGDYSDPNPYPR
ncbi:hypothetical protein KAI56_03340 [Candidatus Parcubacteria bacterium]|nr:hypothetical protein [Candidatus Parcubacteria bacterium]